MAAEEQSGFRFVLTQPAFRLIWFAQLGSQLADKFLMFSLIILAYRLAGGSTPVAFTLLAYTLPAVAIAPLAGVFADRYNRKLIMVSTNFVRGFLILLIPLAALVPGLRDDFLHLLVITFAMAAVGQLFGPAEAAAIPSVLPKEALLTANSMVMVTMVLTLVVGGTLAPIASRVDIYMPYWLATGLFVGAGLLLWAASIPKHEQRADPVQRHPFRQLAMELREGWLTLRHSPVLLLSFFKISLGVLVIFMLFALAPAYVSRQIGIQAQDSYVILVPATLGAIVSALLLGQLGSRIDKRLLLVGSVVATGVTLLVMAAGPRLLVDFRFYAHAIWFAAGLALMLGLDFGALLIPPLALLMETTDDGVRGRVFALLFMVINGATALPVVVAAALSDLFGIGHVIGALGILLIVAGAAVASAGERVFDTGPGSPPPPRPARGRPDPGT